MRIVSILVQRFRNIDAVLFEPVEGLTVVCGENGQGKTNLVEAIFYLATLKSLRAGKLEELVQWGSEACEIKGTVREEIDRELRVSVRSGRRTSTVDGKSPRSVEAYGDVLKVVAFTPDDLGVVKGAAGSRRRWLDRAAFTRFVSYLSEHRRFERALKSRNRLLKEARERGRRPGELDAFDETLASAGARISKRRIELLMELGDVVKSRFESIMRSGSSLDLRYSSEGLGLGGGSDDPPLEEPVLVDLLGKALRERRDVDLARGFTTVGPQADDVSLTLDGKDARIFASQGQQRAVVLALKIGEIENLRSTLGRTPLLLLDDVSSELDPTRNAHLISYLSTFSGQAFVTTTDPSLLPPCGEHESARMVVEGGNLRTDRGRCLEIPKPFKVL